MQTVRVGIIGGGMISHRHMQIYKISMTGRSFWDFEQRLWQSPRSFRRD